MTDPVISVVIPTRRRARYLERCLAKLARADYPDERFDVVVVNDGASEEAERVVASAPRRLGARVVVPDRGGPSSARNAGARTAEGRFVAFTDDDCEPGPGWLAALERALVANPGCAVGGETRNGVSASAAAAASQLVVDAVHAHFNRDPAAPRFFASYNVAFPAEAFRALGGFDERFRYAEDRELCDRWVRTGHRFVHAPDAIVLHMRHLTLREFWGQHYGYGRGAWAFARARKGAADRAGVLGAVAAGARRHGAGRKRLAVVALVALSQAATAAGFMRESAVARLRRRR